MKKSRRVLVWTVVCILMMAGCGENEGSIYKGESVSYDERTSYESRDELRKGDSEAAGDDNWTEEYSEIPENIGNEQEDEVPGDAVSSILSDEEGEAEEEPLTEAQIEEAKQAALDYYEGTVFRVNSISYLEGKLPYGDTESDCNFNVNVSKDGIVQEPDRTISLRLEQGKWEVVNEGY